MTPKATARRYYDLVDAGDYAELVSLFAPDVVYERPGQSTIRGREALREFYETDRPLEDGSHHLHSVVREGDTVAVRGTFTGTQADQSVEIGFADFHEFESGGGDGDRDGDGVAETDEKLIARRYTYTDRDEV